MRHIENTAAKKSKFHWLSLQGDDNGRACYDQALRETDNFVVLPTLGSLVPGWLLLIPKFPISRLADLQAAHHDEFKYLIDCVWGELESKFGETFIFEHGGYAGSQISCGVDQAHLHFVPLHFNLTKAAHEEGSYHWQPLKAGQTPADVPTKQEYFFVSSRKKASFAEIQTPVSQWFRKLIAEKIGSPSEWNYKEYSFLDNVHKTIKVMGGHG
ncbi:hypothetical protein KYK29_15585 [Shinella daejeonensis]|uniref:hypothetical protein n=1 Tax=Shinella daejeonensis TaxID=659017 RepID=UPI0020C7E7F3|nr:hypothetical protein [Shinella daejeonensis]MCP8896349.1 hypothetical protein [Shinella daejeonensis]